MKVIVPLLAALALAGCSSLCNDFGKTDDCPGKVTPAATKTAKPKVVYCSDQDGDNLADENSDGPPGCVDGDPLLIPYSLT